MAHAFSERAASIFGILEQHNPDNAQPTWQVGESTATQAGQEASDSDDDQQHSERIEVSRCAAMDVHCPAKPVYLLKVLMSGIVPHITQRLVCL
jgi:hypothetical protein